MELSVTSISDTALLRTHVVCDVYGLIGAIDEALVDEWLAQLEQPVGFTLVDQHFALAGRCARCRTAS